MTQPKQTKQEENQEREAFTLVAHGLPSEKELAKMTINQIAEQLSKKTAGSVAYIVFSHTLTLRIAKVQSKTTINAALIGAGAALAAVAFGYYLGI
jgi:hypothetical protein